MKYLIEATKVDTINKEVEIENVEILTEIEVDGERKHTSIVLNLGEGIKWWIPISELDHLMYIIDGLLEVK